MALVVCYSLFTHQPKHQTINFQLVLRYDFCCLIYIQVRCHWCSFAMSFRGDQMPFFHSIVSCSMFTFLISCFSSFTELQSTKQILIIYERNEVWMRVIERKPVTIQRISILKFKILIKWMFCHVLKMLFGKYWYISQNLSHQFFVSWKAIWPVVQDVL